MVNLQKEIKVHVRACSEQTKLISELQKEIYQKNEDLKSFQILAQVLFDDIEIEGGEQ